MEPRSCTFELASIAIIPHIMHFGKFSIGCQVLPMQIKCMLHKQVIVFLIIKNIIMILYSQSQTIWIQRVPCSIELVGNMHQDRKLKIIPIVVFGFHLGVWKSNFQQNQWVRIFHFLSTSLVIICIGNYTT